MRYFERDLKHDKTETLVTTIKNYGPIFNEIEMSSKLGYIYEIFCLVNKLNDCSPQHIPSETSNVNIPQGNQTS